VSSWSN